MYIYNQEYSNIEIGREKNREKKGKKYVKKEKK